MKFHMTHQAVLNNHPAQMIPVLKVSFNTVKKTIIYVHKSFWGSTLAMKSTKVMLSLLLKEATGIKKSA